MNCSQCKNKLNLSMWADEENSDCQGSRHNLNVECSLTDNTEKNKIIFCTSCKSINGRSLYNGIQQPFKTVNLCTICTLYHELYYILHSGEVENKEKSDKLKEMIFEIQKQCITGGGYISFRGSYNCEDCDGWDGESRRCECGNRRIDWGYDETDFSTNIIDYIYPECY